jgi:preprotein translocase subunit YajC
MIDVIGLPVVVAQGAPLTPPSLVSQLWPFAVMLLIFYFIVLMPMRKRQKKVQEFQAGLKAGDRVITTGGIHGEVTKVTNDIVQLQVADKVRINVARASIGGYQGQEPVVQQDRAGI